MWYLINRLLFYFKCFMADKMIIIWVVLYRPLYLPVAVRIGPSRLYIYIYAYVHHCWFCCYPSSWGPEPVVVWWFPVRVSVPSVPSFVPSVSSSSPSFQSPSSTRLAAVSDPPWRVHSVDGWPDRLPDLGTDWPPTTPVWQWRSRGLIVTKQKTRQYWATDLY